MAFQPQLHIKLAASKADKETVRKKQRLIQKQNGEVDTETGKFMLEGDTSLGSTCSSYSL